MGQFTIYMGDDTIARTKAAAAKLVKEQTLPVDSNGYPEGFFEHIKANAHLFDDFPTLEEIRASEVPGLRVENWYD